MAARGRGTIAALALVVIGGGLLARALYQDRFRYDKSDFYSYYAWSRDLRTGGDPWAPPSFSPRPEAAGGAAAPDAARGAGRLPYCNYTPAFCLVFSPLTLLEPPNAYWIWQALQIGSLALAILLVLGEIAPHAAPSRRAAAVASALLFPHVYGTLYEAQPTPMLLLLVAGAWVCARRDRPAPAALLLSAAALLKLYPAAVGGYFLFRPGGAGPRRRRFASRMLVWCAIFGAIGLLASGAGHWLKFLRYGVPIFDQPELLRQERQIAISSSLYSLLGWLRGTSSPPGWYALAATAIADLAVIGSGAAIARRARDDAASDGLCLSLWLMAALLLSPLGWAHETVFFLPLYLFAAAYLVRGEARWGATVVVGLGLAGLVVPYFWVVLRHLHGFFLATAISYAGACMLIQLGSEPLETRDARAQAPLAIVDE